MRRNTRLITLVVLAIMLISISISGAAKETLTFVYWQDPAAGPIWKEIIDGFEKENPDIEVKAIVNPADYWTKVLTMVAAGQAPDLMMVDYAFFPAWVTAGRWAKLDPYIERTNFDLSDVWEGSLLAGKYEGSYYAIPMDVNNQAIFYNKTIFDEVGISVPDETWTWDIFRDACMKLTKDTSGTGRIDQYGFSMSLYWEPLSSWIWNNGGDWFNEDGTKCTVNSPETIEAFQFLADLMLKDEVMPSPTRQTAMGISGNQLFMTGRIAMWGGGYWDISSFSDIKDYEWDVAPLPYKLIQDGQPVRNSTLGGVHLAILENSKHKDAAWKFIEYRLRPEIQLKSSMLGLSMPALKSVARGPEFLGQPVPSNLSYLVEGMTYTRPFPANPSFLRIDSEILEPTLDQLWMGKLDAAETMSQIVTKAAKILEKAEPFRR